MNRILISVGAVACAAAVRATPEVKNVTMTQAADKTVTVSYDLAGEDGIVTADFLTNGVSIGGCHLTHLAGDVNRLVAVGTGKSFTWKPYRAWPEQQVALDDVKAEVTAWSKACPPDYMVCSLAVTHTVRFYPSAEAVPFGVTNDMYKTEYLVMRKIPAANVEWRMGSPSGEAGRVASAEIPHLVTLTNDYYIGVYELTQRQWERVMLSRPGCYFNSDSDYAMRPVENYSYEGIRGAAASGYSWPANGHAVDSTKIIGKFRDYTGLSGFDLPTEAQWEFACRAGCGAALYSGKEVEGASVAQSDNVDELARYTGNGGYVGGAEPDRTCTTENGTANVGSYAPNAWGLYDMVGNAFEFCLDWYAVDNTTCDPATGPTAGTTRTKRGGAWNSAPTNCRSASRGDSTPSVCYKQVGLRLYCPAEID